MNPTRFLPLLLLSSLPGCAARPVTPEARPVPLGIYRYSANVEGASLGGIIQLGYMLTITTQKTGVCRSAVPLRQLYLEQNHAGKLTVTCGEIVELRWDANGEMLPHAEIMAPIVEEPTERGPCLRWGTSPRGQARCLEYDRPVSTTRWVRGMASVLRDN